MIFISSAVIVFEVKLPVTIAWSVVIPEVIIPRTAFVVGSDEPAEVLLAIAADSPINAISAASLSVTLIPVLPPTVSNIICDLRPELAFAPLPINAEPPPKKASALDASPSKTFNPVESTCVNIVELFLTCIVPPVSVISEPNIERVVLP